MIDEMRESVGRRLLAVFMAAVLVAGMTFAVPAGQALAADEQLAVGTAQLDTQAQKVSIYASTLWVGMKYPSSVSMINFPDNGKVTKITSSNTKVLKAKKLGSDYYESQLIPKAPGKSKVTVTYKVGSATKSVSATYTVKKFPKAVTSIKINGKSIALPTAANYQDGAQIIDFTGTKVTPKITMANGWKLTYLDCSINKAGSDKYTYKQLTNGKSFSLAKNANARISFSFTNDENEYLNYSVAIQRGGPLSMSNTTLYIGQHQSASVRFMSSDAEKSIKLVSVASSNKSVLAAKKYGAKYYAYELTPKKAGKSTLTMKYKYEGKTYTTKATMTVKPYPNPISSLMINGKAVRLAKNKAQYLDTAFNSSKAKISVATANGWTLGNIYVFVEGSKSSGTIENGSTVAIPKSKGVSITVNMHNSKSEYTYYDIYLRR